MNCAICSHGESRVIDTRGDRRRRECMNCRHRWTTIEVPVERVEIADRASRLVRELAEKLPPVTAE